MAKGKTPTKWAVPFFIISVIIIAVVTVYQFMRDEVFMGFVGVVVLVSALVIINDWRKRRKGADSPPE